MEHRNLIRWIKDNGFDIVVSNRNHMKIYGPDGRYLISIPSTPTSNGNCGRNTVANLRRVGINIPRK